MFYVFSFPPAVYVGTLDLIASIPGPSILTYIIVKLGYTGVYTCFLLFVIQNIDCGYSLELSLRGPCM